MRLFIIIILLFMSSAVASAQDFNYELISAPETTAIATESDADSVYRTLWKLVAAEADRRELDPGVRHYLEVSFRDWELSFRECSRRLKTGNVNPDDEDRQAQRRPQKKRRDQEDLSSKELEHQELVRQSARSSLENLINKPHFKNTSMDGEIGRVDCVGEVLQVVDGQNLLVFLRFSGGTEALTWISGVDSSRMTDDMLLPPGYFTETLWRIKGPRQYTTSRGATNKVLEYANYPLQMNLVRKQSDLFHFGRHLHLLQKYSESKYAEDQARLVHEQNTREWRDVSGKFSIVATFRSVIGENVKLIKEDGSEILVLLEKLSEADRAWISNRK
ncbi:SHD1 domain-containing protein [Blastopirellula sp. J2-11]|uniref:SHD1 domain-containing protein n=1 Tax=Blastopirellula sp. J2-11 TaxID=2943192 RepID=UPI0021C7BCF0|nr:SHD1 domain-containing protein [Blastopirellula sp. J2-11]UUO07346.1 SHD1 domain-containing protein [Blastopirellula sp. J2-11]